MLAVYMFSHDLTVAIVSSSSSAGLYPKENTRYLQNPLKPAFPRAPNLRKNQLFANMGWSGRANCEWSSAICKWKLFAMFV